MLRMLAILNQILEFILPAQTSFWTWAGPRPIKLSLDVPLSLFNLSIVNQSVCFWSLDLEIIIPLHLSFELVSCFYNLVPLHSFSFRLSTDTHTRFLVVCETNCLVIIRKCPSQPKFLWVLYMIHNAFGKLYPLLLSTMLYFWACVIYSWSSWYMF